MAGDISPRISSTKTRGVLHVQRARFFVCGSILSKGGGVRALRKRSSGPAAGPVAHRQLVRRAGKSGKRDEVVAQHDVLHHTRYEGRSARAESERRAADSLHLHRARGQIDHKRLVRIAQQRRRI